MRRLFLALLGSALLLLFGCAPINQPPVPVVSLEPRRGEVPLFISADASASYDPDGIVSQVRWDFGDGTSGEGLSVSHRYDEEGEFLITVTAIDNQGASTSVKIPISAGVSYPLDVLEWHAEPEYFGQKVSGRVKNIGEYRINEGRVAVRFYDSDWNFIRERSQVLGDLAPGAEQTFTITTDLRLDPVGGAPHHSIYTEVLHSDRP